jgi:hypothetical protein
MDNITFIQTRNTKTTGIYPSPTLDVSTITGDYTIFLRIVNLSGVVRFTFNDSMDGFATEGLPGPPYSMKGPIGPTNPILKSFSRRDFPSLRLGTPGAMVRLILTELTGDASKTVTFESWIQYAS